MDALKQFLIPIQGIENTTHHLDYQIDDSFFTAFEDSIIQEGTFKVHLELEKGVYVMDLNFHITGSFKSQCDRCLRDIDCTVDENYDMKVRFTEGESDDIDIVFMSPTANELNVSSFIYEFIGLSIPISTVCEGEEAEAECEDLVDEYLGIEEHQEEDESNTSENPFKDLLKDFDS